MKWCWRRFTAKLFGQQDSRKGQFLTTLSFVLFPMVFLLPPEAQSLSRTFTRMTDPDGVTYSQTVTGGGGAFRATLFHLLARIGPLGPSLYLGLSVRLLLYNNQRVPNSWSWRIPSVMTFTPHTLDQILPRLHEYLDGDLSLGSLA